MALQAALKLALGEVSLPNEANPAEAPVGKEGSKGFGPNQRSAPTVRDLPVPAYNDNFTHTPESKRRRGEDTRQTVETERRMDDFNQHLLNRQTEPESKALSSLNETSGGALVAPASMLGHPIPRCSLVKKSKLFTLSKGFGPNLTHRAKREYVDKPATDAQRRNMRDQGMEEDVVINTSIREAPTRGDSQSRQIRPRRLGSFPGSPRLADSRVHANEELYNLNESADNSDALRHIRETSKGPQPPHQVTRPE